MGDKSPEQLIIEMTAVQEAATEVKIRQLKIEERREKTEAKKVEELQRLARQDGQRLKLYHKVHDILDQILRDIAEIKHLIMNCSVRDVGNIKLDRLFNMLLWDLTAKKDILSPEILRLLEIYRKDHKISVHTGTEIKSDGDLNTGDITGGNKQKIERSAW